MTNRNQGFNESEGFLYLKLVVLPFLYSLILFYFYLILGAACPTTIFSAAVCSVAYVIDVNSTSEVYILES